MVILHLQVVTSRIRTLSDVETVLEKGVKNTTSFKIELLGGVNGTATKLV